MPESESKSINALLIAPGLTVVRIESLFAKFGTPVGYTLKSFTSFVRSIGCKLIHYPDGSKWVHLQGFQLCYAMALRISAEGDFIGFAANPAVKGRRRVTSPEILACWRETIGTLLCAVKVHGIGKGEAASIGHTMSRAAQTMAASLARLAEYERAELARKFDEEAREADIPAKDIGDTFEDVIRVFAEVRTRAEGDRRPHVDGPRSRRAPRRKSGRAPSVSDLHGKHDDVGQAGE